MSEICNKVSCLQGLYILHSLRELLMSIWALYSVP